VGDHAKLSPSGASRWMTCTPSAVLEQSFPREESGYAAEGTHAHKLAELIFSKTISDKPIKPAAFKKKLAELHANSFYNAEMEESVNLYTTQVTERYMALKKSCPDTLVLLEQKLDFSQWVPGGFGTGDVVLVADRVLEVIDLKYGKGVPVYAENNAQMRLYGLGAIAAYEMLYEFDVIRMTIMQPRLDNVSTEEINVKDLLAWAESEVVPKAKMADAGEGEFCAGKHCKFCKARFTCRARADYNLELVKFEFKFPALLDHIEIAEILGRIDELVSWAGGVKGYALDQAENHGVKFPGWKLVEGRSNRKYTDVDKVANVLLAAEYKEDQIYAPRAVLGITALEKEVGKKNFNTLLGELIIKPAGKPTLVPESDKRPEMQSVDAAISDFDGLE